MGLRQESEYRRQDLSVSRKRQKERPSVLILDRDSLVRDTLSVGLQKQGFDVLASGDFDEVSKNSNFSPDIVLIDNANVSDREGVKGLGTPYIVTSGDFLRAETAKILDEGAEFFLPKQSNPDLMAAYIRSALRRKSIDPRLNQDLFKVGDLTADLRSGVVSKGDQSVELTEKEKEMFELLARNQGKVLTDRFLFENLWEGDFDDRLIRIWVHRIRDKLKSLGGPNIKNISGIGYEIDLPESAPLREGIDYETIISPDPIDYSRSKKAILAVDSDYSNLNLLRNSLPEDCFDFQTATSREEAETAMKEFPPDLILLGEGYVLIPNAKDVMVPWYAMVKNNQVGPKLLDMGAERFLQKPLNADLLLASISADERKGERTLEGSIVDAANGVRIDLNAGRVFQNGKPIKLTGKEYKIVLCLAEAKGDRVLSRDIMNFVWGFGHGLSNMDLRILIGRARRRFEGAGEEIIQTIRSLGYRLVIAEEVKKNEEDAS